MKVIGKKIHHKKIYCKINFKNIELMINLIKKQIELTEIK